MLAKNFYKKFFSPEKPKTLESTIQEPLTLWNKINFKNRELFLFAHKDNLIALLDDLFRNKKINISEHQKNILHSGLKNLDIQALKTFESIFWKNFYGYNLQEIVSNREKRLEFYVTKDISSLLLDFQNEINQNKKQQKNTQNYKNIQKDLPTSDDVKEYLSKKFLKEHKKEWQEIKNLAKSMPDISGAIVAIENAPSVQNVKKLQEVFLNMNGNTPKDRADGILGIHTLRKLRNTIIESNQTHINKDNEKPQEKLTWIQKLQISEQFKKSDTHGKWSETLELYNNLSGKWNQLGDKNKNIQQLFSLIMKENYANPDNVKQLQEFITKNTFFPMPSHFQHDGILWPQTNMHIQIYFQKLLKQYDDIQKALIYAY